MRVIFLTLTSYIVKIPLFLAVFNSYPQEFSTVFARFLAH